MKGNFFLAFILALTLLAPCGACSVTGFGSGLDSSSSGLGGDSVGGSGGGSVDGSSEIEAVVIDGKPQTIMHAGGALKGKTLLNCQEAFYIYYEMGCRLFEYDLKLSSDGRLIGTHRWEHLSGGYDGMPYADFTALRLDGGYTSVNEEWLMEMLTLYPDVTVIVDAKMETTLEDAEVIKRLDVLQDTYSIDLSGRIIPEVFSVEMWNAIKDETSFDGYLFSRYKEYYSIETIVSSFPTERFIGVALPYDYLDGYYKRNIGYLQSLGYRIFMFGIHGDEDVQGAVALGADTVYIDELSALS